MGQLAIMGDSIMLMPPAPAVLLPPPVVVIKVAAPHKTTIGGKSVVTEDDLKTTFMQIPPNAYMAAAFLGGTGLFKFVAWPNMTKKMTDSGKPLVMVPGTGQYEFTPTVKAMIPAPVNTPDPASSHMGTFTIQTTNLICTGK